MWKGEGRRRGRGRQRRRPARTSWLAGFPAAAPSGERGGEPSGGRSLRAAAAAARTRPGGDDPTGERRVAQGGTGLRLGKGRDGGRGGGAWGAVAGMAVRRLYLSGGAWRDLVWRGGGTQAERERRRRKRLVSDVEARPDRIISPRARPSPARPRSGKGSSEEETIF